MKGVGSSSLFVPAFRGVPAADNTFNVSVDDIKKMSLEESDALKEQIYQSGLDYNMQSYKTAVGNVIQQLDFALSLHLHQFNIDSIPTNQLKISKDALEILYSNDIYPMLGTILEVAKALHALDIYHALYYMENSDKQTAAKDKYLEKNRSKMIQLDKAPKVESALNMLLSHYKRINNHSCSEITAEFLKFCYEILYTPPDEDRTKVKFGDSFYTNDLRGMKLYSIQSYIQELFKSKSGIFVFISEPIGMKDLTELFLKGFFPLEVKKKYVATVIFDNERWHFNTLRYYIHDLEHASLFFVQGAFRRDNRIIQELLTLNNDDSIQLATIFILAHETPSVNLGPHYGTSQANYLNKHLFEAHTPFSTFSTELPPMRRQLDKKLESFLLDEQKGAVFSSALDEIIGLSKDLAHLIVMSRDDGARIFDRTYVGARANNVFDVTAKHQFTEVYDKLCNMASRYNMQEPIVSPEFLQWCELNKDARRRFGT